MPKTSLHDHVCQVLANRECGQGLKVLRLQSTRPFACEPGQFVMLDLPVSDFHFRRPFSVLDTSEPDVLDVYYKIVGKGTRMMAGLGEGDTVRCLGPLGIGFTPPVAPENALYIGGGIGIAPLHLLAKQVGTAGHCFYGVRGQAEIGLGDELAIVFPNALHLSTDDGSAGFQGNVCQLLEARHRDTVLNAREAYICGPTRMMEASVKLLQAMNPALTIQVSLEEHMPCGTGACTGCVVPRADQYLPSKVCVEGPVFDARAIRWGGWEAPWPSAAIPETPACPR